MAETSRKQFAPLPVNRTGAWLTNHRRLFLKAEVALEELRLTAEELVRRWPDPERPFIPSHEMPPDVHRLVMRRDMLADSVKLLCAIAVEATINYYGVIRLGEHFKEHFERLSTDRKLKALLLFCDGIDLDSADPLLANLKRIAAVRNRLAHPKAREVSGEVTVDDRKQDREPDSSEETYSACVTFLRDLMALVPEANFMLPPSLAT